jgi:phosphatidylglycerol lysyltransferase
MALIPVLPQVPHQPFIHLPGPLRFNVLVALVVMVLLLLGVLQRRAGPWWASIGIVAAASADPTPVVGGAVGVIAILPMAALSLLIIAAAIATLRGMVTSAYGLVIGAATACCSVVILRAGADTDVSLVLTLLILLAVAVMMPAIRRRQRPPTGSIVALTLARQTYGVAQIAACSDTTAAQAVVLPSGSFAPLRTALSVAVVGGDPIAEPQGLARAIQELHDVARGQGLIPCVFQARGDLAETYRAAGYRLIKFGEEAIIDLEDWDLASPSLANVRHEIARARRAGMSCRTESIRGLDAKTRAELELVSTRWRGRRVELGFSMRRMSDLLQSEGLIRLTVNATGAIVAFSSWHALADGMALDMMRRDPEAPPGAMDLSIAQALIDAKGEGLRWASLGSVPFRDQADDLPTRALGRVVRRLAYDHGLSGYHYRSLARFKGKFNARWVSRTIATGGGVLGFPLALIAIAVVHRRWSRASRAPTASADRRAQAAQPNGTGVRERLLDAIGAPRAATTEAQAAVRSSYSSALLGAVVAALITGLVLLALRVPLDQWLLSEGAGIEVSLMVAITIALAPASALVMAIGMRPRRAMAGIAAAFAGVYLIPLIPRLMGTSVASEIASEPTLIGWVRVLLGAIAIASASVALGMVTGRAIHGVVPRTAFRVRRSRRFAALLVGAVALAVVGASSAADVVSVGPAAMAFSYQPNSSIPRGDVESLTVDGRASLIYKPAILRTHSALSLPVIYFLHGQPGAESDWLDGGAALPAILDQLIASKSIPPLVAVMPDGSADHNAAGVWSNTETQASETWIITRLMPAVAQQVRTEGRACTGMAGFSEGGYAAMNIALRHPDLIGVVASYSGYFDADPDTFGPAVAANSPSILAPQLDKAERMPVFLGAGSVDEYLAPTQAFAAELTRLHWTPMTLQVVTGGHAMGTWRALIADSLTWIANTWKNSATQTGAASVCSPQF